MRSFLPLIAVAALACGQLNEEAQPVDDADDRQNAIVGGSDAAPGQFAHQISLQSRWGFHYCGGSLIGDGWVLTAAHCVDDPASQMRVMVGSTDLNSGGQTFQVAEKIPHPAYNSSTMDNDVALLRLSSSTAGYEHVALATEGADDSIAAPGVMASVSGWGALSEGGSSPDDLQFVDVPLMTNGSCNVAYNGEITSNMVCAGYSQGGQDSCQGDSGGPMVVDDEGSWVQNGVVSWGYGCARPGVPGVYARVSQYENWISSHVPDAVFTDGGEGAGEPEPTPEPTEAIFVDGSISIDSYLSAGETEVYTLIVPEDQTLTIFTSGDTDTYGTLSGEGMTVSDDDTGAGYNFKLTPTVDAGTYELAVRGYNNSTTGDFTLVISGVETDEPEPEPEPTPEPEPEPEPDSIFETGLSDSRGNTQFFSIDVPDTATVLEFVMAGGSGDADLYVRRGSEPTTSSYDCRPYRNGNEENCTFSAPEAGTYHVMVRAYSTYSGVTLSGSYE